MKQVHLRDFKEQIIHGSCRPISYLKRVWGLLPLWSRGPLGVDDDPCVCTWCVSGLWLPFGAIVSHPAEAEMEGRPAWPGCTVAPVTCRAMSPWGQLQAEAAVMLAQQSPGERRACPQTGGRAEHCPWQHKREYGEPLLHGPPEAIPWERLWQGSGLLLAQSHSCLDPPSCLHIPGAIPLPQCCLPHCHPH